MKKYYPKFLPSLILFVLMFSCLPFCASAAELVHDQTEVVKAKVVQIEDKGMTNVPGLDLPSISQLITATILEGKNKNENVSFNNDYIALKKGDVFYLNHTISADDGREFYSVQDPYRLPVLYFFIGLFVILVLLIGGIQGVRGLISLIGSLLLITYVLLPGILHGFSPVLVSIGVASLIIILGSYITHGFNRTTSSAVAGMILTVIVTGIMAYFAVHFSEFNGYGSEEALYLNLNSRGHIDLVGILIGGIMIGLLGVLYDIAIGQSISVEELHHIAPHIPRKTIFKRAMRIGREHIGALINTLAIAYVGASLPLLLLFSTPPIEIGMTINKEIFASEIIRILIGSIGLILAVPITTLLATVMLIKVKKIEDKSILQKESEAIKYYEHHH